MPPTLKAARQPDSGVERRRAAAQRARGMLADLGQGRSLADELIRERRGEAQAEAHDGTASRPTPKH